MQPYQDIMKVLNTDNQLLDELITVLTQETEMLKKRKFQQLDSLSTDKNDLVIQLEQSFNKRMQLLKDFGDSDDPQTLLQSLLTTLSSSQAQTIQQNNQQIEAKLSQCRHTNTVNGQVIAVNLHSHQTLNNIVSGKNNVSNTYSASGQMKGTLLSNRHEEI